MKREYDIVRVRKDRVPQAVHSELEGLVAAFKKQKKYAITDSEKSLVVWETVDEK